MGLVPCPLHMVAKERNKCNVLHDADVNSQRAIGSQVLKQLQTFGRIR